MKNLYCYAHGNYELSEESLCRLPDTMERSIPLQHVQDVTDLKHGNIAMN